MTDELKKNQPQSSNWKKFWSTESSKGFMVGSALIFGPYFIPILGFFPDFISHYFAARHSILFSILAYLVTASVFSVLFYVLFLVSVYILTKRKVVGIKDRLSRFVLGVFISWVPLLVVLVVALSRMSPF